MQILLYSHWFSPSVGGVETVSKILAEEFAKAGAGVTVATNTPSDEREPAKIASYSIVRRPSSRTLLALARKSNVNLQNTISLRSLVPMALSRNPIVITHQSWLRRPDGSKGPENHLKLLALRACKNVSISRSIADSLPVRSTVIGNPFDPREFAPLPGTTRDRDIVFMGRLIREKGCDLLLRALSNLKSRGTTATLSVVGEGPEMASLKALASELGLTNQVDFLGSIQAGRGQVVARHKIMAVPSLWAEPFGIVALEGIASGCAIVASSQGGLPGAAGPCGILFPNGDLEALTTALHQTLTDAALRDKLIAAGPAHLKEFQPHAVAERYLGLFRTLGCP